MIALSSVIVITVFCLGTDFTKTPPAVQLEDGDTFVFIGNSITHQCLYTQYVEDYYYTRYPGKRLHFHNAGVSGDVAADVNIRFVEDIQDYKPKYASILIGMNDGQYTEFDHEIFNTYKQDMSVLLEKLDEGGISPILITPTMFDLRAAMKNQTEWVENEDLTNDHYNATLAFFGSWLYQVATERGFGFINMHEPLNRITRENRSDNPEFTLIEDAVHPGPDGQVVMALAFLRDIGADPFVSSIHIDLIKDDWEIIKSGNGKLEKLDGGTVRFRFTAISLPWVLPEEASLGYELTGAGSTMSREIVRITGLEPGNYIMHIDDELVGEYTHLQFATGVELQENELTPQYKQAAEIALLNKKRNEDVIGKMRDLWLVRKLLRQFEESADDYDNEEEKEEIKKWLESEFGTTDLDEFLEDFNEELQSLKDKAKSFENQIYELNKPVPRTYKITRK